MEKPIQMRLIAAVVATACIAALLWMMRPPLYAWTRQRLTAQHLYQLQTLPENEAALLVQRLARHEQPWLEVIVAALADQRPLVAAAGSAALVDTLENWEQLPAGHPRPQAALLARLLARQAPSLSAKQLTLAQTSCQRLLLCPQLRQGNSAQLIADCEAVLRLYAREEMPADLKFTSNPREGEAPAEPRITNSMPTGLRR